MFIDMWGSKVDKEECDHKIFEAFDETWRSVKVESYLTQLNSIFMSQQLKKLGLICWLSVNFPAITFFFFEMSLSHCPMISFRSL